MRRWAVVLASLAGLVLGPVAQAGTVYYDYTDPQGNVLALADAQGHVVAKYDYAPYGAPVASLGSPPNGPGYTGHVNDPETGLVYMQARYYVPVGRFPSPDPVGVSPGNVYSVNRYAYANNNPIVNTDPTGMFPGDDDECSHSAYPCQVTYFGSGNDGGSGSSAQQSSTQGATSAQAPSRAKQFLIGLSKPVVNLLDDIAAVMGDSDAQRAPPLRPSNPSQAVGMMVSGVIVGAAEAAATDGDSLEITGGKPFAMGLDGGLDSFAEARGATTWKSFSDPFAWKVGVIGKLSDPDVMVHFNLDGVDIGGGLSRAASGRGGATDWELMQIRQSPQWWNTLQFWRDGRPVPNPFSR